MFLSRSSVSVMLNYPVVASSTKDAEYRSATHACKDVSSQTGKSNSSLHSKCVEILPKVLLFMIEQITLMCSIILLLAIYTNNKTTYS